VADAKPAHSPLGASSSERWLACPGSIRLSQGVEQLKSSYAAEGTAAHWLAEQCLRTGRRPEEFQGCVIPADGFEFTVDDEMIDAVELYVDEVKKRVAPGDEVDFEVKFHLDDLHDDFYGTADVVIYHSATRKLTVVDFKYGKGVAVEAINNPQLLYYGYGAAKAKHNRGVGQVDIIVVQPRCPHPDGPVRVWETDLVTLLDHAGELVDAAARTEQADAALVAGHHCKFCPAAHFCSALTEAVYEIIGADESESGDFYVSDPTKLSPEQITEKFKRRDMVKSWLKRFEDFAHHEAESGRVPPGLKLVSGRPTRVFKDPAAAKAMILMTFDDLAEEDVMTPPELKSPAQVEAVIGRKNKKFIADLIESKSSKTVLAPIEDPRPAVVNEASAEFAA
jgi:hypothetical protein